MALIEFVPADKPYLWYPKSTPQYNAMHSKADMLLFGGQPGAAKTDFLIADAVRERDNKNLRDLFLRESFPQLEKNVLPRMRELYTQMGAYYVSGVKRQWTFPSGAVVMLGVIAKDSDILNYQGNPFSALHIDEAGNHPESHLRDILPWLRTTDPSLFRRVRLSSNPGGIGAAWEKEAFLRGYCPVHNPKESVEPGAIYRGSRWLSDGAPIPLTVSFIPGKHTDHNLLGPDYADLLRTQKGERAEQFLKGCWCKLEGAYFAFMRPDYVVPFRSIGDDWWWTHYLAIDFGYGSSASAAGMFAVNEAGKIYLIKEKVERKMMSADFAKSICEEWVSEKVNGQRRRVACCYIDPANDNHDGTGKSNFEIMEEVFEQYEIPLVKASKGRVANAQRLLQGLFNFELTLCDTCPQTYKSISTRMCADNDNDVKKIRGEDLDDLYDMLSYGFNTFLMESIKPKDVAARERLKEMADNGMDEHSLNIYRQKFSMEIQVPEPEIRIARRGLRRTR